VAVAAKPPRTRSRPLLRAVRPLRDLRGVQLLCEPPREPRRVSRLGLQLHNAVDRGNVS
jgi:hypothetical protein